MRKGIVLSMLAAVLAMAPAASAELRAGTSKDRVGDAQVAGIGFPEAKDIVQVDARYDTIAGDIVMDATMGGDVPSLGRHYVMFFTVELRSRGASGCDGEQRVKIDGGNYNEQGFWDRYPMFIDQSTGHLVTGYTQAKWSGRQFAFRVRGLGYWQTAALQNLDLTCVTVEVRGPGTPNYFFGTSTPGPVYDRLDAPVSLRQGTPKVSLKSTLTRDRSKPFAYKASGVVAPPTGVAKNATACTGGVFISLKRRSVTVGATTVKLKPDCTYAKTVSVKGNAKLAKRNGRTRGTLKLGARFAGNPALNAKSATSKTVSYGPR